MRTASAPLRAALVALIALAGAGAVLVRTIGSGSSSSSGGPARAIARPAPPPPYATAPAGVRVLPRFKLPPAGGMLFDLRTGRVLWSRLPRRARPIASLAKMMTAIVVADRTRPNDRVLITPEAIAFQGSGVGNLPLGRRVRLETLLYGLLLPSGNDAAIALAQHVSRSVPRFVRKMNAEAHRIGLRCSHFSSPDGYEDRGNAACPRDLAVLAREVLARPRLARIVQTRQAIIPTVLRERVEYKRGKRKLSKIVYRLQPLYLNNHNPLLRDSYRGTTGIKTGYTDAAGRCLVATVRRGRIALGVVLLHSPVPGYQAERLFDRAFAALRRPRR